jgi:Ca2+-binding RTX toxin-like protein
VTQISIPGGQGSTPPITFTITGNAAINLASDFNAGVQNASTITSLSSSRDESTVVGALNLIESSATTLYGLSTGHQYTYAAVTSPTRITGSSTGGDTILAGGGVTYDAVGARNRVVFYKGNNVFNGDSVGGDVISGGAGNDTINTGAGSNTIFTGSGNTQLNLGDTSGGDVAVLLAGNSTVSAQGVNDVVYASAALGSAAGTIFGGTGVLGFVAGASSTTLPITIVGGSGTTYIFANSGSDISLENSTGRAFIIAGGGNETLNGAAAVGGFAFFGDTVAADASSIDQTIVGGQGADYFSTGGGNETVTSGSGAALFHVNDLGSGTNITIANVSSHDFFNFGGLPVSTEQALLAHDTSVSGGNLNLTLPDGTKVEFLNVTTFTGHLT